MTPGLVVEGTKRRTMWQFYVQKAWTQVAVVHDTMIVVIIFQTSKDSAVTDFKGYWSPQWCFQLYQLGIRPGGFVDQIWWHAYSWQL